MALNQLNGQARFTDTTATDDDELVLSQELLIWIRSVADACEADWVVASRSFSGGDHPGCPCAGAKRD
jgi:hypothetical protein